MKKTLIVLTLMLSLAAVGCSKTQKTEEVITTQVAGNEKVKIKRVQNTFKAEMAKLIEENKKLKEENEVLKLKVKRVQNTYKAEMAKKIKEIEELKKN